MVEQVVVCALATLVVVVDELVIVDEVVEVEDGLAVGVDEVVVVIVDGVAVVVDDVVVAVKVELPVPVASSQPKHSKQS